MAFDHNHVITENGVRATVALTADYEFDLSFNVNPEETDKEIDIDFVYTRLKSLLIVATGLDDGETITVESNTDAGGGGSWTLTAPGCLSFLGATNNPWAANPFTADVTRMYFTNNSEENIAAVRITGLYDASV